MTINKTRFSKPYGYQEDELQSLDFNRQIVLPGIKEEYPDGVVFIYVDSDFWCVAGLPLDPYKDKTIQEIVADLWPTYVDDATYGPDHGTIEQDLFFANERADAAQERYKRVWNERNELLREVERLRLGRTDVLFRKPSRVEATHNYFIRQYEHLLTATAHHAVPKEDLAGVCSICNLLCSNRVHDAYWIAKHDEGYESDVSLYHLTAEEEE